MLIRNIILFFCILCCVGGQSQDIQTSKTGKKLGDLLSEIIDKQGVFISFDEQTMSSIILPEGKDLQNIDSLFSYIQRFHYIKIDTIGDSFVLSSEIKKKYLYQGKVFDAISKEALLDAEVICDDFHTYTSSQGYFSFLSDTNTPKKITIRHLGYVVLDTTIMAKSIANIPLNAHIESLKDVLIKRDIKSYNIEIGSRAGALRLTPEFISKLPGYGESSIYSFLKLMPGVLATGESVNDISLRGSYEGQNLYLFDNYRIYNPMYKLNDIGTINPLIVKDIEVYKSGIDASVGENVGGVLILKGLDAISSRTKATLFVNNFIANAMVNIPLNKKMALILSGRKNIKEKLKIPDAIGEYTIKKTFDGFADNYQVNINPRYNLYDNNLKFIYKINDNSTLSIGGFSGFENNKLDATTFTNKFRLNNKQVRSNRQYAGAIHFSNYSLEGNHLDLTASYSSIRNKTNGLAIVDKQDNSSRESYEIENNELSFLQEFRVKAKYRVPFLNGGFWDYGVGFTLSNIEERQDPAKVEWNKTYWHQLSYAFASMQLPIYSKLNANIGARLNYSQALQKFFVEPRLSLNYYPDENWKMYASYGTFQQFIYNVNMIDELKNIRYSRLSVQEDIPVFQLNDFCLGARYLYNKWALSAELFYKYTDQRVSSTYITTLLDSDKRLITEKVRYLGGDFFLKYQTERFVFWLALTLSDFSIYNPQLVKTGNSEDEKLNNSSLILSGKQKEQFRHSKYDMRQEFKWAATYTWHKISLSLSYISGSGFKLWQQPTSIGKPAYSRLDMGIFYKDKIAEVDTEVGVSILNVFNRKNKRLDEFSRFGVGDNIISYNTYGLELTPALYLKVSF